ncbi:MAG: hypothetical protein K2X87_08545 [Gemmataceae bacterium]|nr:hypothetical protein [Gemmataceae bacterium]
MPTFHKLAVTGLKAVTSHPNRPFSYLTVLGSDILADKLVRIDYRTDLTIFWEGTVLKVDPRTNNRVIALLRVEYKGRLLAQTDFDTFRSILPVRCSISIDGVEITPMTPERGVIINLYDDSDEN